MSELPRFHVVVRFAGRIVDDRCVRGRLTVGDGGDVVVPGLGDAVVLIDGERVCDVDGLVARTEGDRVELVSTAYPELEIAVERVGNERVAMRHRFFVVPARETIVAGALAACIATMLGGKVVIGSLTEPEIEREREQTALELAMFAVTPVIPETQPIFVAFAEPPAPIEVVEALPIDAEVLAATTGSPAVPSMQDIEGEVVVPTAVAVPEAAPKKKRARPRRSRAEGPSAIAVMKVLDMEATPNAILGASVGSSTIFDVLDSGDAIALDSLHGAVEGGVVGGTHEPLRGVPSTGVGEGEVQVGTSKGSVVVEKTVEQVEPVPAEVQPTAVAVAAPLPDPRSGKFSLADAFAGDDALANGTGTLTAIIATSKGRITCELFEAQAPITVANFVGLARGTREWLDAPSGDWRRKSFYDGLLFHRVVQNFVVQGGDPTGEGKGGPGYEIPDEHHPDLKFDGAGVLAMANKGPNTGGSQFFVSLGPAPHLDGKHAIFGKCDTRVVERIAKVDVDRAKQDRPVEPVTIRGVDIVRVAAPAPGRDAPPHAQPPRDENEPPTEAVPPAPPESPSGD